MDDNCAVCEGSIVTGIWISSIICIFEFHHSPPMNILSSHQYFICRTGHCLTQNTMFLPQSPHCRGLLGQRLFQSSFHSQERRPVKSRQMLKVNEIFCAIFLFDNTNHFLERIVLVAVNWECWATFYILCLSNMGLSSLFEHWPNSPNDAWGMWANVIIAVGCHKWFDIYLIYWPPAIGCDYRDPDTMDWSVLIRAERTLLTDRCTEAPPWH